MSRDDGFVVMDVSTDYVNDPKWRKLVRFAPDALGDAFIAYTATVAESWHAGRRVSVEDAWPALIGYSQPAVDALQHVGLLDNHGLIPSRAWRGWFETAKARRDTSRERWARSNEKRREVATRLPRGDSAATASTVPSVTYPSVPTAQPRGNGEIKRRRNTVDSDPELSAYKAAILARFGPGMDEQS